tara:strand:+ start:131 stop:676 length:546 start_codon:yes stop_codon:yes gene_type:complete
VREDKRPKPKKLSEKGLKTIALGYLARYSTSTGSLRKFLMGRLKMSGCIRGASTEKEEKWIEALIIEFEKLGYLNDYKYAENRFRSLLEKGKSIREVRAWLRGKNVSRNDIDAALEVVKGEICDPEFYAALELARRRKIGPYNTCNSEKKQRDKALVIFARAGFSYALAKRILDAKTIKEL